MESDVMQGRRTLQYVDCRDGPLYLLVKYLQSVISPVDVNTHLTEVIILGTVLHLPSFMHPPPTHSSNKNIWADIIYGQTLVGLK